MARASAGLTPAWAWAVEKRKDGSRATPPTKPRRVKVLMTLDLHFVRAELAEIGGKSMRPASPPAAAMCLHPPAGSTVVLSSASKAASPDRSGRLEQAASWLPRQHPASPSEYTML